MILKDWRCVQCTLPYFRTHHLHFYDTKIYVLDDRLKLLRTQMCMEFLSATKGGKNEYSNDQKSEALVSKEKKIWKLKKKVHVILA